MSRVVRRAVVAVSLLVAALSIVLLTAAFDRATLERPSEQQAVGFGLPLDWLFQDHPADPPPGVSVGIASPWEAPTSVDAVAFLADLAAAALLLALLGALVRRLLARRPADR